MFARSGSVVRVCLSDVGRQTPRAIDLSARAHVTEPKLRTRLNKAIASVVNSLERMPASRWALSGVQELGAPAIVLKGLQSVEHPRGSRHQ
jgi:hypothetical protein